MERRERMALRVGGYVAFFVASFLVMLYLFFPIDRWKGTIEESLSVGLDRKVSIGSVGLWGLTGIKLFDVTIEKPDAEHDSGHDQGSSGDSGKEASAKKSKQIPLEIDRLGLRLSLMAALTGKLGMCFDARIFDGAIKGCWVDGSRRPWGAKRPVPEKGKDGPRSKVEMSVRSVELEKVEAIRETVGLPFDGEVNGDIDLEYVTGMAGTAEGEVELEIKGLRIGKPGGKLDLSKAGGGVLKGEIAFDPIEVGDLVVRMSGKDGKIAVEKFDASGKHMEIRGAGDVTVREPLVTSAINIYVMFKFLPSYVEKSSMTKSIFSALDRLPKLRQAKRTDGYFGFLLRGDFRTGPKPIPSRSGPAGASSPVMSGPGLKGGKPSAIGGAKTIIRSGKPGTGK